MLLDEYQVQALKTSTGNRGIQYAAIALAEEVGELCGKVKKMMRGDFDDQTQDEIMASMIKEGGDALWYLSYFFAQLDIPLSRVAEANLAKLADRKARGVIKGSGDDR